MTTTRRASRSPGIDAPSRTVHPRPSRGRRPRARRSRARRIAVTAALAALGLAAPVAAEPPPTQPSRFAASADSHITAETSDVLPAWTPSVSLVNTYGQRRGASPSPNTWSVQRRATSHLLVAFGLFDWVELDLGVPMVIYQEGTTANTTLESSLRATGIGDVRTGLKGTFLKTPARGFGLGASFDVTFPTGTREALLGEAGPTYAPQLLGQYRFAHGIEAALNVGYFVREDVTVGSVTLADSLTLRGAFRVPFGPQLRGAVLAEADGAVGVVDGSQSPLSIRGGFRWRFANGMSVGAYAGGAVVQAFGLPDVEGMFNVGWAPPGKLRQEVAFKGNPTPSALNLARRHDRILARRALQRPEPVTSERDPDGDGLLAANDRCPDVPEDIDRFEDEDGCPELDNDRDGVRDVLDMCPLAPEVVNGWADWDGCPDRRIDASTGQSSTVFDPNVALPQIVFAGDEDVLSDEALSQVDALIALLELNPWLGRLDLAVAVNVSTVKDAEIALAARRRAHLAEVLAARGLSPRRYRFVRPRSVTRGIDQAVHYATADAATGLRPVGATDEDFDTIMAAAVATELDRRQARGAPQASPAPATPPSAEAATSPTSPTQSAATPPQDGTATPPGEPSGTSTPADDNPPPPAQPAQAAQPAQPNAPAEPGAPGDAGPADGVDEVPAPTAPPFEPPVQRPKIPLPGVSD